MQFAELDDVWKPTKEVMPAFNDGMIEYDSDSGSDSDSDSGSDNEYDAWVCTQIQTHLQNCESCQRRVTQQQRKKKPGKKQKRTLKETFLSLDETGLFVALMTILLLMGLDMYISFLKR